MRFVLAVPDVDFDATTAAEEYLSVQISIVVTPSIKITAGSRLCYLSYIACCVCMLRTNPMTSKMHEAENSRVDTYISISTPATLPI